MQYLGGGVGHKNLHDVVKIEDTLRLIGANTQREVGNTDDEPAEDASKFNSALLQSPLQLALFSGLRAQLDDDDSPNNENENENTADDAAELELVEEMQDFDYGWGGTGEVEGDEDEAEGEEYEDQDADLNALLDDTCGSDIGSRDSDNEQSDAGDAYNLGAEDGENGVDNDEYEALGFARF